MSDGEKNRQEGRVSGRLYVGWAVDRPRVERLERSERLRGEEEARPWHESSPVANHDSQVAALCR